MASDDSKLIPVLRAMRGCESVLWERIDAGDMDWVSSVYELNCDIEARVKPDDPVLGWAVSWAKIEHAECLYAMNRDSEAMSYANSIGDSRMNAEQKLTLAWIRGLSLSVNNQFAKAADQFRIVAAHHDFKYGEPAFHRLVLSLLSGGDIHEAIRIYARWVTIYHLIPRIKQGRPFRTGSKWRRLFNSKESEDVIFTLYG